MIFVLGKKTFIKVLEKHNKLFFSNIKQNQIWIIKISFNDCQPKTIGFRVLTSNLDHLHG